MSYWVYILTNKNHTTLYVGVTGNLQQRIYEHKMHDAPGFTSRYRVTKLIYLEEAGDAMSAIAREKQIKRWGRWKKEELIASTNPEWKELKIW